MGNKSEMSEIREASETTTQVLRKITAAALHRAATMPTTWCKIYRDPFVERPHGNVTSPCVRSDEMDSPCVAPVKANRRAALPRERR
jgi:hypothetical protein